MLFKFFFACFTKSKKENLFVINNFKFTEFFQDLNTKIKVWCKEAGHIFSTISYICANFGNSGSRNFRVWR